MEGGTGEDAAVRDVQTVGERFRRDPGGDEYALVEALAEWAAAEGVAREQLASLRVGAEGGVRGLFAARDIEEGETILEMPAGALLTEEHVRESPLAPLLTEFCERESQYGREPCAGSPALAMFLLLERGRGAESRWGPYIAALPRRFELPLFWDEADVALLRGTRAEREVRRVREWAANLEGPLAARAGELAPELRGVGAGEVRWALGAVWSRAFGFAAAAPRHLHYRLAPFFDLMNHAPTGRTNTVRSETAGGGLRLAARRRIAAGEQVFNCYGPHPTTATLANWGFVVEGNGDDALEVGPLEPPPGDPPALQAAKRAALRRLGPLRLYPTGLGSRLAAAAAVAAAGTAEEAEAAGARGGAGGPAPAGRPRRGYRAGAARAARASEGRLLAGRLRALLAGMEGRAGAAGGGAEGAGADVVADVDPEPGAPARQPY
eukprot:tig00001264_g7861.t1